MIWRKKLLGLTASEAGDFSVELMEMILDGG
jgi:hypothetical protein